MYSQRQSSLLAFLALAAVCFSVRVSTAQGLSTTLHLTGSKAAATTPSDPFGRTSPRSAVYNFLQACHKETLPRAAQYLDLSRIPKSDRATEGLQLARDLCILINRDPQFELINLSNAPDGSLDDGLPEDEDLLDVFHVNGETVPLYLRRENVEGNQVWLVSADSVARLPQLSALTAETPFEKHLPAPLIKIRFIGTPLWICIVLVAIAVILGTLSRALSRAVIAMVKQFVQRGAKSLQIYRLENFVEPLRLLLSLAVFRIALEFFAPSALLRQYLLYAITLLVTIGVASFVMRLADVISDRILSRLDPKERALSYSVFRVSVRFIKICIFCTAVLFLLHQWGYRIDAILAGLGVGGLAVALAAQKTIENLFGGISVISDRPDKDGDVCKFGDHTGTVLHIGLRSTRIQTADRTIISIPNSQFSSMPLENVSRRDKFLFHPVLNLRRDTTSEQLLKVLSGIGAILKGNEKVETGEIPVRFIGVGPYSLDVEVVAYVRTVNGDEFLALQQELLLRMLRAVEEAGTALAVPVQEVAQRAQAS